MSPKAPVRHRISVLELTSRDRHRGGCYKGSVKSCDLSQGPLRVVGQPSAGKCGLADARFCLAHWALAMYLLQEWSIWTFLSVYMCLCGYVYTPVKT